MPTSSLLAALCYLPSQIHLCKQQLHSPVPGLFSAASFQSYFPGSAWPPFNLALTTAVAIPLSTVVLWHAELCGYKLDHFKQNLMCKETHNSAETTVKKYCYHKHVIVCDCQSTYSFYCSRYHVAECST